MAISTWSRSYREATRILQLDHGATDWVSAVTTTPARVTRLDAQHASSLRAGAAADMVLTRARSMTELLSRPQSDRTVLVAGRAIDTTLPDYAELDTVLTA
jgi:cytosine/creatinine deaminase